MKNELSIGDMTIPSRLVLAPMAGISDLPYRMINRSFGCRFAFTEMISANALVYGNRKTLDMLSGGRDDRPLGVQLLGSDPVILRRALESLPADRFDIVDINAACPAPKVAAGGMGAALMKDPVKLQRLVRELVKSSCLPVTVKIRAGWDESSLTAVEAALRVQEEGASALTVHGRTARQGYRGKVDYGIISSVREALTIPVIASGDALTPDLVKKMFDETGCHAVALARGALGNPWLFPSTERFLGGQGPSPRPDVSDVVRTMKEHLEGIIACYGEEGGVMRFRKFFPWYTKGMGVRRMNERVFRSVSRDDMLNLMKEMETVLS